MISHRHRCLYVKVPKCASTAVLEWFRRHGAGRYTDRPSWYPGPLECRIVPGAAALALYPDYFTFTFLRNPYRRFASLYLHANRLVRNGVSAQPRSYGTLGEFAELCRELLAETRGLWGREAMAFRARHAEKRYGPLGIPLRRLRYLVCHARPQVDFAPDCNRAHLFGLPVRSAAPLGFVGSLESLDADFHCLQAILGLPRVPLPRGNVSARAAEVLASLRRDRGACRLIEEIYAEDFAFAGYPRGRVNGRARGLPMHVPAPAPRPPRPLAKGEAAVLAGRRARFALASAEMAVESRIARTAALRRALAPLARLRRKLG